MDGDAPYASIARGIKHSAEKINSDIRITRIKLRHARFSSTSASKTRMRMMNEIPRQFFYVWDVVPLLYLYWYNMAHGE
jgi:hypothetical protein